MKTREVKTTQYYCEQCDCWLNANETVVCESCRVRQCGECGEYFTVSKDDLIYLCERCYKSGDTIGVY